MSFRLRLQTCAWIADLTIFGLGCKHLQICLCLSDLSPHSELYILEHVIVDGEGLVLLGGKEFFCDHWEC